MAICPDAWHIPPSPCPLTVVFTGLFLTHCTFYCSLATAPQVFLTFIKYASSAQVSWLVPAGSALTELTWGLNHGQCPAPSARNSLSFEGSLRDFLVKCCFFLRIHMQWKTKSNLLEHDLTRVKCFPHFWKGKNRIRLCLLDVTGL